jgi:hypothetical protein
VLLAPAADHPLRVSLRFAADEAVVSVVHGLLGSGLLVTDRRLYAWRGEGALGPVPASNVGRVIVDLGEPGVDHLLVLVAPRNAIHVPLTLVARPNDLEAIHAFVEQLATVAGANATVDAARRMHRFTFEPLATDAADSTATL